MCPPIRMKVLWTHAVLTFDGNDEFDHDSTSPESIRHPLCFHMSSIGSSLKARDKYGTIATPPRFCQGDPASVPPSTEIDAPITKEAESDKSHATASRTSELFPQRPAGL